MLSREQIEFLFPMAFNAAVRAGDVILEIYRSKDQALFDMKSDLTPITLADRAAHNMIKSHLGKSLIPILSEEGREMLYDERKEWDLFWVVDPLDGTKEFLKGNNEFTVNISLMESNRAVISVIYVPYLSKLYFCNEESGAMMKSGVVADKEANCSYSEIMAGSVSLPLNGGHNAPIKIAVSRSHKTEETMRLVEDMRRVYPDAEIVEQGSSYKFCLLAEGSIDFYIRTTHTYEWDTAAGEHILESTGGVTHSIPDKQRLLYNKSSLQNPYFECYSSGFKELHMDKKG